MEEKKTKKKPKKTWIESHPLLLFTCASALWLIFGNIPFFLFTSRNDAASYGDSFGMITSLSSALALAGVIYALVLQIKELRLQRRVLLLQRQEMEDTREVLKMQRKEMEESRRAQFLTAYLNALQMGILIYNTRLESVEPINQMRKVYWEQLREPLLIECVETVRRLKPTAEFHLSEIPFDDELILERCVGVCKDLASACKQFHSKFYNNKGILPTADMQMHEKELKALKRTFRKCTRELKGYAELYQPALDRDIADVLKGTFERLEQMQKESPEEMRGRLEGWLREIGKRFDISHLEELK